MGSDSERSNLEEVSFLSGGIELLSKIILLRKKLLAHHRCLSLDFNKDLDGISVPESHSNLAEYGQKDNLLIEIAMLGDFEVGYCVSFIDENMAGEIYSLYADDGNRGKGIAGELIKQALAWFREKQVAEVKAEKLLESKETARLCRQFGIEPS